MKNIFLLIISVLLFSSCNEKSNSLLPFKEGESINYINEAPRTEMEIVSVKVLSVQEGKENVQYVNLSSNPFFGEKDKQLFLKIDIATGKIVSDAGGTENLLLPDTKLLKKGYAWMYGEWNALVDSETETVATEKNTYNNCLKIYYNLSITAVAEVWIKPGVGIVKFGSYRTNPPSMTRTFYVLN